MVRFFFLLVAFFAPAAFASFAPSATYSISNFSHIYCTGGPYTLSASSAASVASSIASNCSIGDYQWTVVSTTSTQANFNVVLRSSGAYRAAPAAPVSSANSCPSGSTLSGGQCTCTAPLVESGGQCVQPTDPCQNLTGAPLTTPDLSVPVSGAHVTPTSVCETVSSTGGPNGGPLLCAMTYTTKPDGMWAQSPDGKWYFFVYSATEAAKYKYSGSSCTDSASGSGGTNPAPAPTPSTCATGTCPGTVNGTNVCVPCSGAADEGPKETTTNTDANGTTTPGETKDTAVTCEGNYCTIKTTSTNPDGTYTTSSKTQDKKSYCEENPTFPACTARWQDKACDSDPVCEGDPIACAQAKLAHKTYCENFVKVTPLSELGTTVANGEAFPDGHPRSQAITTAFNFAGAFGGASAGGGGCPADVTVMGVVVPLSSTCDGLNGLGIAALGIALIWAARVVFGD